MRPSRPSTQLPLKRPSKASGKARPESAVVQATAAKNRFGAILKRARAGEAVVIAKRGIPEFVVLEYQRYHALLHNTRGRDEQKLDALRDDFDALYVQMQSTKSRHGVDQLLSVSAADLNQTVALRAKARG
jgi:prevent-host-death family protein